METRKSYTEDYFKKQYQSHWWRKRGEKPTLHAAWVRKIIRISGRKIKYLEVGCGEGFLLRSAQDKLDYTTGFDISISAIRNAKSIGCSKVIQASAFSFPYADEIFDFVIALDVVEHLDEPEELFLEARRVLKTGGRLIISTPNPDSLGAQTKGAKWFGLLDTTHCSIHKMNEWRDILEGSGFSIDRDGTDSLWDTPYFSFIPSKIQWLFFITLKHCMTLIDVIFPWKLGENYVCIAIRK